MQTWNLKSVAEGEIRRDLLTPSLGHPVEIPMIIIRGLRSGPTLLVTAGVHGAEYASIEAANQVARTDPQDLAGTLVVLPVVNPPSFFARSIYTNPIDQKNLNRVFPGQVDGTFADRLAHWLTEAFICQADVFIDLHGGDLIESLVPFTIYQAAHSPSHDLAKVFGLPYLIASHGSGHSYSAGSGCGVPSILAEAGGQGQWPEQEVERLRTGVHWVMQHLKMLPGEPTSCKMKEFNEFAWLRSEHAGYWYPQVTAGDQVDTDQQLGIVTNLLGDIKQHVVSPVRGVVLFGVSSLAINEGDPLVGVGA